MLRANLRACWTSNTLDAMATTLNPLLAATPLALFVQPTNTSLALMPHMPDSVSLLARLTLTCAWGLVEIVQQYGLERMRSCAAEPCRDVFIDTSRNKSRRFCSERCANRYNVADFRDRQKNADD